VAEVRSTWEEFAIHASPELLDHRTQVLKHGESFMVSTRRGDIESHPLAEHGLYYAGTRHLSQLVLLVNEMRPLLLGSAVTEDNLQLLVDLTNPEVAGEAPVPQYTVHLLRERLLREFDGHERLVLVSHAAQEVRVRVAYEFGADFRDIFEVRGIQRQRRGVLHAAAIEGATVTLAYDGLDGVTRATALTFAPPPDVLTDARAEFDLLLLPGRAMTIELTVACRSDVAEAAPAPLAYDDASRAGHAEAEASHLAACSVESSNRPFNAWLQRATADLHMMMTETTLGPFVYAGVPWFSAPFGRDALITALEMLTVRPSLAAGVLRYLAATQATTESAANDAQPGKILHEARRGEMADLGEVPFGRYYGSVDATPLFVMLAGAYLLRTDDRELIADIRPQIDRALQWMEKYGDHDGDGFLDYQRQSEDGLINQGWKDSADSVSHADGSLASGPVALCEVQAYAFAAWRAAARIAAREGDRVRADQYLERAASLRRAFDRAFWQRDLRSFAIALDGEGRPCRIRSSNAGHALFTGIARQRRASALATTLMAGDSFSGWGVRTLSARESRYNPMSYHNGSVWPHDNALIARGLARYGHRAAALSIMTALYEGARWFDGSRLPELFCGLQRRPGQGPTLYPVACAPQSWAAGAVFMLIDACLGIEIDGRSRRVRLVRPTLPAFLDDLSLRRLAVGSSLIDLHVRRHAEGVSVEVNRRDGDVQVTVVE